MGKVIEPTTTVRRLPIIVLCALWSCLAQEPAAEKPQGDTFKFETKLNVVLVPVLARDKAGRVIGDLKKEDFQVYDKGKPQTLTGFTIQKRAGVHDAPLETTNSGDPAAPKSEASKPVVPERFIAFVFDDLHLNFADLALTQKAAIKMFSGTLSETDMAAVISISGKTNSGMTRDRAKLTDAVNGLRVQNLYQPMRNCPDVSYYQADLIENKNDTSALNMATNEAISCANLDPKMRTTAEQMAHTSARQALALGEQGTRVSLRFLTQIIRAMGRLPGQHSLILVSPGFLTVTAEAMTEKSIIIDEAAQANVTVSAVDARGLYVTMMDASEPGGPSDVMQKKSEYHAASMGANEDIMAELADGTGGKYIHNSNDIAGGLRQLTEAPEYLYLLEFSPQDVKQDGTYHKLKVEVNREGVKLQSRRGYYALKASKKK